MVQNKNKNIDYFWSDEVKIRHEIRR